MDKLWNFLLNDKLLLFQIESSWMLCNRELQLKRKLSNPYRMLTPLTKLIRMIHFPLNQCRCSPQPVILIIIVFIRIFWKRITQGFDLTTKPGFGIKLRTGKGSWKIKTTLIYVRLRKEVYRYAWFSSGLKCEWFGFSLIKNLRDIN